MCETNRLFNRALPKTDSAPSHPNRTHSCNRASSVASSATRIQSPHKYVDTHRVTEAACFPTLANGFDELDDWGECQLQRSSKVDPGVALCVPKAIGYLTERGVFDIAQ